MNAPMYIERNKDKAMYDQLCMKLHSKNLNEIQGKNSGRLLKKNKSQALIEMKQKNNAFVKGEKDQAISKENKILLDKISHITQGKTIGVVLPPITKGNQIFKKSLNFESRK